LPATSANDADADADGVAGGGKNGAAAPEIGGGVKRRRGK
jgi:hypothetical protein